MSVDVTGEIMDGETFTMEVTDVMDDVKVTDVTELLPSVPEGGEG